MLQLFRTATILFLLFTVLTGIVYPLAVTGVAAVAFPKQAQGSIAMRDGQPIGSELLGQPFDDPRDFWGRPSATAPVPYNGMGGSGSNQAATNPALIDAVRDRVQRLHDADPGNNAPVPIDLVSASGSGLDPHISPAAAYYQAPRIAKARGLREDTLRGLIDRHTEQPTLGFLGQPRVNVIALNLALDALSKPNQ